MAAPKPKLLFVFGTRPEALKLAPVVQHAVRSGAFRVRVCLTAQHREMVDQVLRIFKIRVDHDLNLMRKNQSLGSLTSRLFPAMEKVLRHEKPDLVIVQGDTTSAFAVALQAFYDKIAVAHVEAGLRTGDTQNPFPEEMNRMLISHVAAYHFAPTREARRNLLAEGISAKRVYVTGNTVVDALAQVRASLKTRKPKGLGKIAAGRKWILVTAHRRESFGAPLREICGALRDLVRACPEVEVIYPVHLNPKVQKVAHAELGKKPRLHLLPPVSYEEFLWLMERCYLILTDSGGIQEEAPSFHKPVLVMRKVTERPDGVALGLAKLVGTSRKIISRESIRLVKDRRAYLSMIKSRNPYGDGRASSRIVNAFKKILRGRS